MRMEAAITIFASEIDVSRAFYAEQLGFAIEALADDAFVARRDGLELTIEGGARPRRRGRRWMEEAGVYITLRTDDFDRVHADLAGRGVAFLDEVTETADGRRITGFADPDGTLFELTEREPRPGATAGPDESEI